MEKIKKYIYGFNQFKSKHVVIDAPTREIADEKAKYLEDEVLSQTHKTNNTAYFVNELNNNQYKIPTNYIIAEYILKKIAKQQNWQYISIVNDSYIFDNGLMCLVYGSEEARRGEADCSDEEDMICINIDDIDDGLVTFEHWDWSEPLDQFLEDLDSDEIMVI